jgi:hypothetical protein
MSALFILDRPTPLPWLRESRTAGESARVVRRLVRDAARDTGRVASGWRPIIADALAKISDECDADDWDGLGAAAITFDTTENVRAVCDALFSLVSNGIPAPELTAQSDGEISASWVPDADRILSISIGPHHTINYAGQMGDGEEPHGVQHFNPDNVHSIDEISGLLQELYPGSAAAAA